MISFLKSNPPVAKSAR